MRSIVASIPSGLELPGSLLMPEDFVDKGILALRDKHRMDFHYVRDVHRDDVIWSLRNIGLVVEEQQMLFDVNGESQA